MIVTGGLQGRFMCDLLCDNCFKNPRKDALDTEMESAAPNPYESC